MGYEDVYCNECGWEVCGCCGCCCNPCCERCNCPGVDTDTDDCY